MRSGGRWRNLEAFFCQSLWIGLPQPSLYKEEASLWSVAWLVRRLLLSLCAGCRAGLFPVFRDGCSGTSLGRCVCCRPEGVEEQVPLLKRGWNHLHAALAGGTCAVSVWVNSGSQGPAGRVIHHLLLLSAQMTGYQRGHPGHPA